MTLIKGSIRYPVTVIVGVLIAVIAGFVSLSRVPVQLTPEVERPRVSVTTAWPGASPEEVEKDIIEKQEEFLKSIEGVVEMQSESHDGYGQIVMEFPNGTDITGAVVKVTNKLNEVRSYPENAERPVVSSSNQFENAIAWFVIKGDSGIFVPHMQTMVEDLVKPRLERVQGVSSVNAFGGVEQELHITFDPHLLASAGITIAQLRAVLQTQNRDISAGDFSEGKRRYLVRTVSRFESIEDVEQTVITVRDGAPIRIIDVAEVTLGYQKPVALVRHLGQTAIAFNAQKQVGANVLDVMDGLLDQVEVLNEEVMRPRGLLIENVYNQRVYIDSAIDLVFNNIYLGGFLAILMLFLFLRSPSAILVIATSIPISIITTFLTMYALGRTVNVISLAGMAFAVGMVVDSSIVVLENIYRHMQMGKKRWQAAADATGEVWGALLASAVTTVAVFLPVLFVQEQAGQLFRDIAVAISSAIVIALIVSITVIPTFSSRVLKISKKLRDGESGGGWVAREAARIAAFVDFLNASTARRLAAIIGVVAVSVSLTWILMPAAEYLPNGNQNFVFGGMLPPPGYNIDQLMKAGETIESQFRPLWEADDAAAESMPGGGIDNFFYVGFGSIAFLGVRSRDAGRAHELIPVANRAIFSIPGNIGFAQQASLFGSAAGGTRSMRIDVTGPELPIVLQSAAQIFGQIGQVLPGSGSRPSPGLDLGNPEVRVYPDRIRAADIGMSASEIGSAINALVDGAIVSEYHHHGREIDLLIRAAGNWTKHTQDIENLPMATPSGRMITVGDVGEVRLHQGPVQINHVERQRAVSIATTLPDDIALENAMVQVEEQIIRPMRESGGVNGLYDIHLSGAADDLTKLRGELFTDFMLAIVLTYLLMAALFQSFTYPLVIMITVPLATFGGVLGLNVIQLFARGQQLDILTMLGFVILVGTVINNAILIVYQALHGMRDGLTPRDAVRESVRVRVRPILMSTGTSALAMLPLVIMPGAGSELYRGLGSVVIGGLAISTVMTLALTPLVFSFTLELKTKIRSMLGMTEQEPTSSSTSESELPDWATEVPPSSSSS